MEILHIVKHAVMITSFVIIMMLIIEFINVLTHGTWQKNISHSKFWQYVLVAFLGATPGCLGAFTVVSLYSHKIVTFGSLVATMIATSGDETYLMLSQFPLTALLTMFLLIVVGVIAGILTDKFYKKQNELLPADIHSFELHKDVEKNVIDKTNLWNNLKSISFERALLLFILVSLLILIFTGKLAADEEGWVKYTLAILSIVTLFLTLIVSDHFLEKHFWEHVIKKHIVRIFLWTFFALLVVALLYKFIDINSWIKDNLFIVLIISALIGLIPESGPHMVFVTLFAEGLIPFSIFFTSSIVQDGHGTLPLIAVSKKGWFVLKLINFIFGLTIGSILLLFGM